MVRSDAAGTGVAQWTPRPAAAHRRPSHWRRLWRNWSAVTGGGIVAGLVVVAVLAPVLAPRGPTDLNAGFEIKPPARAFPFGTDELGRDILSRVIYGARISLAAALGSVTLAAVAGVPLGTTIGFLGGAVDLVAMRLFDVLFAFPAILLAIALVAALGPSLPNLILTIAVLTMPQFAVLARGATLATKALEYVQAAIALGAPNRRIVLNHILPNVMPPMIVSATLNLSIVILIEAGLSFLGLGTQPPTPSWGGMISRGRQYMTIAPWLVVFPGLAIMLAVLGFNLLGDGLRETLDPRLYRGGE